MKKTILTLFVALPLIACAENYKSQVWSPDNGDGTFTNPVIDADYSDPDVCVGASGEDFYLTASSFAHIPGLPILHSKDLVNWEIINHAIKKLPPYDRYNVPQHGNGVWAPSIRYNQYNQTYYIYWGDPDLGIFVTTAKDPAGEWTEPQCILSGKGMIDTCPLWDEDGRCYLVNGWANSRCQFNSVLTVREMTADGMKAISDPVIVFDGNGTNDRTSEGPKFYKRDGWYWIMNPAGGVPIGHQLAMRSRSPFGPYESKTVLAQGDTDINGPHQGGWVHLKSGEDWFLHFQDKEAYGRVVHLNPVDWSTGWPVMGKKGEPVTTFSKPKASSTVAVNPQESDEFNSTTIGKQWQWQANYDEKFGVPTAFGSMRVFTYKQSTANLWLVPNMLLQKTPADEFMATTKVRFTSKADGQMGGIIMMGLDYSALVVKRVGKEFQLLRLTCKQADKGGAQEEELIATLKPTAEDKIDYKPGIHEDIYLLLRVTLPDKDKLTNKGGYEGKPQVTFAYSMDGKTFRQAGSPFQMRQGKWIGAKFGYVCVEDNAKADRGWLDIDWMRVTK